jgi:hypothetical protein
LGLFGPLAPVVPVLGYLGRPLYFTKLPWPWSSLILGAVYGADAEESERGSPSVRWVSGSGTHGSFCRLLGPLAPVVPVLGYHRQPLCFHGLSLILGFAYSVELEHRPCSLRIRLEGLAGGSCLSSLWWAAGSVQYPASLPQIHQAWGVPQEGFPTKEVSPSDTA